MRELLRTIARRSLVPSSWKTSSVVSKVHRRFARFKMVISFLRLSRCFQHCRLIICVTHIESVNKFSVGAFGHVSLHKKGRSHEGAPARSCASGLLLLALDAGDEHLLGPLGRPAGRGSWESLRLGLRPTRATKGLPCPRWRRPSLYPRLSRPRPSAWRQQPARTRPESVQIGSPGRLAVRLGDRIVPPHFHALPLRPTTPGGSGKSGGQALFGGTFTGVAPLGRTPAARWR